MLRAFIELEKASDTIPQQEVRRSKQEKNTREKYVEVIQGMHEKTPARMRSVRVSEGKGFAWSPFLFSLVINIVTANIGEEAS